MLLTVQRLLESLLTASTQQILRLTKRCLRRPKKTILTTVLLTVLITIPLVSLEPYLFEDSGMEKDAPGTLRLRAMLEDFGSREFSLITFECERPGCILEADNLDRIDRLTTRLEADPSVHDVLSLTTLPQIASDESDALAMKPIVSRGDGWPTPDQIREALGSRGHPVLKNYVVDEAYRSAMLIVETSLFLVLAPRAEELGEPDDSATGDTMTVAEVNEQRLRLAHALRDIVQEEQTHTDAAIYLAGATSEMVLGTEDYVRTSAVVIPSMVVAMCLVLALVLRSKQGVIYPFLTVVVPTAWTMGAFALTGRPVSLLVPLVPTVLMAIGVTDAIHLIVHYFQEPESDRELAVWKTVNSLVRPCFLTSITTSTAFLSLAVSPVPVVSEFGVLCSLGVLLMFLFCFTLLPVLMCRMRVPAAFRSPGRGLPKVVSTLLERAGAYPFRVLLVTLGAIAIFAVGFGKAEFGATAFDVLDSEGRITESLHKIEERIGSSHTQDWILRTTDSKGFNNAERIRRVAEAVEVIRNDRDVHSVISIHDSLAWVASALGRRNDDVDILSSDEGVSQLLLLAEEVDPSHVRQWITADYQQLRIAVRPAGIIPANDWQALKRRAEEALEQAFIGDESVQRSVTSPMVIALDGIEQTISTLITSFSITFVVVFVLMFAWTGSFRLACIAMIPNLIPALAALGYLGYRGVLIDYGTMMVASIVIGIAIDDTIHWLHAYSNTRGSGASLDDAIRTAFSVAGTPIVFTTFVLIFGFSVWGVVNIATISQFGIVTAIGIGTALVADLFVLPAALRVFDRRGVVGN